MAIRGAVRFKPDMYRSSLEATVAGLNAAATPPTGSIVMMAQLVAYDDTVVTGANYKPGRPDIEQEITVLYEEPIMMDLSVFSGKTQAQSTAMWSTALTDFANRVSPAAVSLLRAIRAARLSAPQFLA